MEISEAEVFFAFQQQLYEYLKSYTPGEVGVSACRDHAL